MPVRVSVARGRWAIGAGGSKGAAAIVVTIATLAACGGANQSKPAFPKPGEPGRWPFRTAVWGARVRTADGAIYEQRVWAAADRGMRQEISGPRGPSVTLRLGNFQYAWRAGERSGVLDVAGPKFNIEGVLDALEALNALATDVDSSHATVGPLEKVAGARCRRIDFAYEISLFRLRREGSVWVRLDRPFPMKLSLRQPEASELAIERVEFDQPLSPEVFATPPELVFHSRFPGLRF